MNCKTANVLAALAVCIAMSAWVYWLDAAVRNFVTAGTVDQTCIINPAGAGIVCEVKP